jgi:regulator of sigma E protease
VSSVVHGLEVAVALGLIIFVHELGHFLAAKAFGVRVRRFGIGLPFTGPILKWTRGDTQYGLYPIVLGGFVDLAGEHRQAEGADDPKALWRCPAWQRIIIFSAGVGMNALLAVVFFSVAFMVGVRAQSPVVGATMPDSPAAKAGLLPGDRILQITKTWVDWLGRPRTQTCPVRSFDDVLNCVGLADAGTEFGVEVERPPAAPAAEPKMERFAMKSLRPPGALMPILGIFPEREPRIAAVGVGSVAQQAGLEPGDRILAVNGARPETWRDLLRLVDQAPAGPLSLALEREGQPQTLTINPAELRDYGPGFEALVQFREVAPDMPAAQAGIKPGDRIMKIGGVSWPTEDQVRQTIQQAGIGGSVALVVWRRGEAIGATCTPVAKEENGKARAVIGVILGIAINKPVQVGQVKADGPADRAGLRAGDVIVSIGRRGKGPGGLKGALRWLYDRIARRDRTMEQPDNLVEVLAALYEAPKKPLPLVYRRGESQERTMLAMEGEPLSRFSLEGCEGQPLFIPMPRIYNPLQATAEGLKQAWLWLRRTYASAAQMARGQMSPEGVGGPVLIVAVSFGIAELGMGTFLNFWGMLSVCVTVLNFLPLPPFDGGHVLFVLIEKMKGSPVSPKIQSALFGVGWVLVGALFVLLMYKDVTRLW